jgi:hypothetical protein
MSRTFLTGCAAKHGRRPAFIAITWLAVAVVAAGGGDLKSRRRPVTIRFNMRKSGILLISSRLFFR